MITIEPRLAACEQLQHLNCRKEVGCDNSLANLYDQRVLFDLDVFGNLNEMFAYPKSREFYIINDWNTEGNHVLQAAIHLW